MDLDLITKGLGAALETVPGLRVATEIPNKVNPPVALIGIGRGDWDTFEDTVEIEFGVLILLGASNTRGAQELLRAYLSTDGDYSVRAAIEADNTLPYLGVPTTDTISCNSWDAPAVYPVGDQQYIGVEFNVTAMA